MSSVVFVSSAVKKRVMCDNCITYFHKSCASKKTKKCCETEDLRGEREVYQQQPDHVSELGDVSEDDASNDADIVVKALMFENQVLKDMNKDLGGQIHKLQEQVDTLKEENQFLNSKLERQDHSQSDEAIKLMITDTVNKTLNNKLTELLGEISEIKSAVLYNNKLKNFNRNQGTDKAHQIRTSGSKQNGGKKVSDKPVITSEKSLETQQALKVPEVPKMLVDVGDVLPVSPKQAVMQLESRQREIMQEVIDLDKSQRCNDVQGTERAIE